MTNMSTFLPKQHNDVIYHFRTKNSSFFGKIISLNQSLNTILSQHDYPENIAYILGELVLNTALLGHMLPHGIFTAQITHAGPIHTIIADYEVGGNIRGYASYNNMSNEITKTNHLNDGHMMLTMMLEDNNPIYQNHITLSGKSLTTLIQHYFQASEKIDTILKTHIFKDPTTDEWIGRAIMLQHHNSYGANDNDVLMARQGLKEWKNLQLRMESCVEKELNNPKSTIRTILEQLYPSEQFWIEDLTYIKHHCRCSRESLKAIIPKLSASERKNAERKGKLTITCQFCGRSETF